MLEHKGYVGAVEFDAEARLFHGEVVNMRDVITFQGLSVDEIEMAFRDSVDDYIEWCRSEGVVPEMPYSGTFNVSLSPSIHRRLAFAARRMNLSIDRFVERAIVDELNRCQ